MYCCEQYQRLVVTELSYPETADDQRQLACVIAHAGPPKCGRGQILKTYIEICIFLKKIPMHAYRKESGRE